MYDQILHTTAHRSHALPPSPWLMTQRWDHLLFMHLPVSAKAVEALIPKSLELDTYEGNAWISIIPFQINDMHLRKLPPLPYLRSLLELNVRTYVKKRDRKGVYFFSLDADKLPAVLGARIFAIPYFYAKMNNVKKDETIHYQSQRRGNQEVIFKGSYRPISEPFFPETGSLNHWLMERYFLWADRENSLYRGDIHHKPWAIQEAEVNIEKENMIPAIKREAILGDPIFHYVSSKRVLFWLPEKVR